MPDILSITQNPYSNNKEIKLLKNWQYVQVLHDIGCQKFKKDSRGAVYIDGIPKDRITMMILKSVLREQNIKYRYGWLNDVIHILAAHNADLRNIGKLPDWLRPPARTWQRVN